MKLCFMYLRLHIIIMIFVNNYGTICAKLNFKFKVLENFSEIVKKFFRRRENEQKRFHSN